MDTDGKGTAIYVLIRVIRVIRGCGWLRLAVLRSLRLMKSNSVMPTFRC
jgi:hypothetical protein